MSIDLSPALQTPSGATARQDGEHLELCAPDGSVLVRYDAATGALELRAPQRLSLDAPEVAIRTERLEVEAKRSRWQGGHVEVIAGKLVERAGDVFRHAEGVLETRAGRARTFVERTMELWAHRTFVHSERDTRIDGKRVLLG